MSDPKGNKPNPEHPQEDELLLDLSTEHEEGAPQIESLEPLVEPGINASTDDFQFAGPVEELDFTEPPGFTFPSEAAEAGAIADSSADLGAADHAGLEHLLGAEGTAPHDSAEGKPAAEAVLAAEAADVDLAGKGDKKAAKVKAKPKRELPAWVHALEWTAVALLAVGALSALFVSIIWLDANTATLVLNISFPVMLALIPYTLWRSSRRWLTPSISALYTVLLAISAAALIGGAWVEGSELASYEWQFNKARLAAGKPRQQFVAPIDPPAEEAK